MRFLINLLVIYHPINLFYYFLNLYELFLDFFSINLLEILILYYLNLLNSIPYLNAQGLYLRIMYYIFKQIIQVIFHCLLNLFHCNFNFFSRNLIVYLYLPFILVIYLSSILACLFITPKPTQILIFIYSFITITFLKNSCF